MGRIVKENGFTFVELVLTMVLLSTFAVATGYLLNTGLGAYSKITERNYAVHNARFAILRMQKELELLRQTQVSDPTRIAFLDNVGNVVEFSWDGSTLFRGTDILAENVQNLQFTYYNKNGNAMNSAGQVRRIHIDMSVRNQSETVPGVPAPTFDLRTDVFPRGCDCAQDTLYDNFQ